MRLVRQRDELKQVTKLAEAAKGDREGFKMRNAVPHTHTHAQ